MKHDIDTLVADICAAYPELAGDAVAVRAIVSELVASQPTVTVDESFKTQLRAKLLMKSVEQRSVKKNTMPWWLMYTVPVGVVAVLLLVVYPDHATAPQQPVGIEMTYPAADSSFKINQDAMQDERSAVMETADMDGAATFASSDFFTATFVSERSSVRVSYITLSQPGFVVVSGESGVVAMSEILIPGEHTEVEFAVSTQVQSGKAYTATLFYDNGDGVYTEEFDFVAYDLSGVPVSMQIVAP